MVPLPPLAKPMSLTSSVKQFSCTCAAYKKVRTDDTNLTFGLKLCCAKTRIQMQCLIEVQYNGSA